MRRRPARALLASLAALACAVGASAQHAHEHGRVRLNVAVDGDRLTVELDSPLANLLGFERAPRSEAERQRVRELARRLRDGSLVAPPAAAGCRLVASELSSAALDPALLAAGPPGAAAQAAAGVSGAAGEHADFEARLEWQCSAPKSLAALSLGLADAYKGIERIEVQLVTPKGQSRRTLGRGARQLPL